MLVECEGLSLVKVNNTHGLFCKPGETMEFQTLTMISPVFWQGASEQGYLEGYALVLAGKSALKSLA